MPPKLSNPYPPLEYLMDDQPFESVQKSKDKGFWVDVQGNGDSGNLPTVWMDTESIFAESRGRLFINAKESPGSLCFQLYFPVK